MGKPTEKTIKRLFALSANVCAFPGCMSPMVESANAAIGEICHIRAQRQGGPRFDPNWPPEDLHGFENLMLFCPNHHRTVDTQPEVFPIEALRQMKATHERDAGRPERADDMFGAHILLRHLGGIEVSNNSGNVVVASPGAIVGQTVDVRTTRQIVRVQPPEGTLGADPDTCRYVEYLIRRYNKFASADKDRAKPFHYGAISKTIKANYGAKW